MREDEEAKRLRDEHAQLEARRVQIAAELERLRWEVFHELLIFAAGVFPAEYLAANVLSAAQRGN